MECPQPDCRGTIVRDTWTSLHCPLCGQLFWQRGAEIIRKGEHVAVGTITRGRAPSRPARPARDVRPTSEASEVSETSATSELPADLANLRVAGMHCPACHTELVRDPDGNVGCWGCGQQYWMRGAELVPAGTHEALEVPTRRLPEAKVRIRKLEDPGDDD